MELAMTDSPLSSLSSAIADVVAKTAPAIVSVHSHRSRASGFVWKSGFIITADEALAEEGEVSVRLADGTTRPATIAGRDHTTDIALLKTDTAGLTPIKLSATVPVLGSLSPVVAATHGAPNALLGIVSLVGGAWRSMRGGEIDARIELDVRLRHSHEGGLALDAAGNAFGMAVFGPRRVLVIPAVTIERVAPKLETHGRIARGYLGLGLQPVRLDDGGVGAMVMSVDAKGPGAAAGVRQGDVIVAWDGRSIRSVQTLLRALGPDSVGSSVRLSLKRAGDPADVSLTIRDRPDV
jgi:S1-C subfamily serine protease